jgi:glutamyl-tRNA synthetase
VIALRDRVKTLKEMAERARCWYLDLEGFDADAAAKHLLPAAIAGLSAVREKFAAIAAADWSISNVDAALRAAAESIGLGLGKVAQPLRVAMTGTQVSPSIDHTVFLVGRERALTRIDAAIRHIEAVAA